MGLDINTARFLLGEKGRGIQFGKVLTLGRQGIYMEKQAYDGFMALLGVSSYSTEYADEFFGGLGAENMKSMDASAYENADILHDINEAADASLHSTFDTVIDGGTLEHVFNFPVAISNCMKMVKPGGQLILMTPWHNYAGHGFYQFSPELIYNILSPENGYQVERMLIVAEGHWYSVRNPTELMQRVEIRTDEEILLYVTAKRLAEKEIFSQWPQQSDYSAAWQRGSYHKEPPTIGPTLKSQIINKFPILRTWRGAFRKFNSRRALKPVNNPGLIRICPSSNIP